MSRKNNLAIVLDSKETKYEEYEELLVRRDQLLKEAGSYMTVFTQKFGDMIIANFKLKIECIKKKKAISYCRRRINRGLAIDTDHMQAQIEQEMSLYYAQLRDMIADSESAKRAKTADSFRFERAKKIYRRLAKLLHPDINMKTMENEGLKELWTRIVTAYHRNDADELDDLEVLVGRALENLGEEGFEANYSDLDGKIERIERQINDILTTEPYTYGELLVDEEKMQAYRNQLKEEHESYEQYLESLSKSLDETLEEGGATFVWKMD